MHIPMCGQLLEFAKRFKLSEVWGEKNIPGLKSKGFDDGKLPDVLAAAQKMGYSPDDSLYKVLFENDFAKKFKWPDPVAKGHANSTVEHLGVDWFVEKALFEEYAQFGRGHEHDLAEFDVYYRDDIRGLKWPVSTETRKPSGASTKNTIPTAKPAAASTFTARL